MTQNGRDNTGGAAAAGERSVMNVHHDYGSIPGHNNNPDRLANASRLGKKNPNGRPHKLEVYDNDNDNADIALLPTPRLESEQPPHYCFSARHRQQTPTSRRSTSDEADAEAVVASLPCSCSEVVPLRVDEVLDDDSIRRWRHHCYRSDDDNNDDRTPETAPPPVAGWAIPARTTTSSVAASASSGNPPRGNDGSRCGNRPHAAKTHRSGSVRADNSANTSTQEKKQCCRSCCSFMSSCCQVLGILLTMAVLLGGYFGYFVHKIDHLEDELYHSREQLQDLRERAARAREASRASAEAAAKKARHQRQFAAFSSTRELYAAVDSYLGKDFTKANTARYYYGNPIGMWDVSRLSKFDSVFSARRNSSNKHFDEDLSGWNISAATSMKSMFHRCDSFNQPLNSWDVSLVRDFRDAFDGALKFNQDLSSWRLWSATDMRWMFFRAAAYDQDLSSWLVPTDANTLGMFFHAYRMTDPRKRPRRIRPRLPRRGLKL